MKKTISISLIILCLLLLSFSKSCKILANTNQNNGTLSLKTLVVPDNFKTIQEAINNATLGDIIFVRKGTYYENLVINKSISLIGEDKMFTFIDGGLEGCVVSIRFDNVSIEGFTIRKSGLSPADAAIVVEHCNRVVINRNVITNNNEGISLYSSTNNIISNNIISLNNYHAVSLYLSSGNIISNNTITENCDGIYLLASSANVISGNTFSLNMLNELYLTYSNNNTIYHNNFKNASNVWSDSKNIWNHEGEGNYWSNYSGKDVNEDGIGDTPYLINVDNQDRYPLMGTFSVFRVDWQGKTHNFNIISNSSILNLKFKIGVETGNKILSFNIDMESNTAGFCRMAIPTELMNYTLIVLIGEKEEKFPKLLNVSSGTYTYIYFKYTDNVDTIAVVSSKMLFLYNKLIKSLTALETSYNSMNGTYYILLKDYDDLLNNYTELNESFQEYLLSYTESINKLRNLTYIITAALGVFIITMVYLSKKTHASITKTNFS